MTLIEKLDIDWSHCCDEKPSIIIEGVHFYATDWPSEKVSQALLAVKNYVQSHINEQPSRSGETYMNEEQVKHMVNRFLGWKLPEDFRPDCGIHFDAMAAKKLNPNNAKYQPYGTSLFNYAQAEAMVRYMIAAMPRTEVDYEAIEGHEAYRLAAKHYPGKSWLEALKAEGYIIIKDAALKKGAV